MNNLMSKGWRPLVVIILCFVIWEAAVRLGSVPKWLLPAPTQIFQTAFQVLPDFFPQLLSTVGLAVAGLLIGSGTGLFIAIVLHLLPKVKAAVYPLLIVSQNIPTIVLAPLLVIWFGFGALPKLIVIALVCFFPVVVSVLDGFRQIPRELHHYFAMAGASKVQAFLKLELPGSLPSLVSGLKIAATYSVMGAVISEWLGAEKGIGVFMTLASSSFQTDRVFVSIFWIVALSLLFFGAVVGLEKRLLRWQPKEGEK
ncbi:ABC transporter permease [Camelliibacillus cellulosilyticus]|uniref:ABC transporter permease n=1 Tax=Camelliibacillus cellulosilyticus TaxID=2174486 RepID=A0ABV9GH94_9BACL